MGIEMEEFTHLEYSLYLFHALVRLSRSSLLPFTIPVFISLMYVWRTLLQNSYSRSLCLKFDDRYALTYA